MNSTDFVGFHSASALPAPTVMPIRQAAPTPMDEILCKSFNFSSVSCRPRGCIARRMALFRGEADGDKADFLLRGLQAATSIQIWHTKYHKPCQMAVRNR